MGLLVEVPRGECMDSVLSLVRKLCQVRRSILKLRYMSEKPLLEEMSGPKVKLHVGNVRLTL